MLASAGMLQKETVSRIDLVACSSAPFLARHHAEAVLNSWRLEHLADTAMLLASELVTNAALFSMKQIGFALRLRGSQLIIEVGDTDPRPPARAQTWITTRRTAGD